jgi:hypothetical protein
MSEELTYTYSSPSSIQKSATAEQLFLSQYSEVYKKQHACFFWGKLSDPFITSRCLITLSNVVRSSFSLSPAEFARMKDPIVTAGNEKVRFEGFSQCAGVYARVDLLPGSHDGEFIDTGTTNVDFNPPMITALSGVLKSSNMLLSVGSKEVTVQTQHVKVTEKKVPLPQKWIKGLTTVQLFLANTDRAFSFNRMQAIQLFRTIPARKTEGDHFLITRGGQPLFSPVKSGHGVCIGGIERLKLLDPLLPHTDELRVFAHEQMQSTTWQLYFGPVCFSLTLSRDSVRGFSGEGAALEDLLDDTPQKWIERIDNYAYANHEFNATLFAIEEGVDVAKVNAITSRLSAMGLLGFDLDANSFFYRQLPYNPARILSLNPRLGEAEKLITGGKVNIVSRDVNRIEAHVEGTGVTHVVVIDSLQTRCTCTWFSRNRGERGPCKHILAVKKLTANY